MKTLFFSFLLISFQLILSCSQEERPDVNSQKEINSNLKKHSNSTRAAFPQLIDVSLFNTIQDAIDEIDPTQGVTIYFPCGQYNLSAVATGRTELFFDNLINGLEIIGDGNCTTLFLENFNEYGSVRMINIRNSDSILISNLRLDGNRENAFIENSQGSNIFIRGSENIIVDNVESIEAEADSFNIGASSNILIENSFFDLTNRNGITIGGGVSFPINEVTDINIRHNFFGSEIDTQQIDFEGAERYSNVVIHNNNFEYLNTNNDFANQYAMTPTRLIDTDGFSSEISENNFNSNSLLVRNSVGIIFKGNINVGKTVVDRLSEDISFLANNFDIIPDGRSTNGSLTFGITIREVQNLFPSNIIFEQNDVIISNDVPGFMHMTDVIDILIENNNFDTQNIFNNSIGLRFRAQDIDMDVELINNNYNSIFEPIDFIEVNSQVVNCIGVECAL